MDSVVGEQQDVATAPVGIGVDATVVGGTVSTKHDVGIHVTSAFSIETYAASGSVAEFTTIGVRRCRDSIDSIQSG